jgi:hypothetical protein
VKTGEFQLGSGTGRGITARPSEMYRILITTGKERKVTCLVYIMYLLCAGTIVLSFNMQNPKA